jgi:hypothetical protein
LALQAGIKRFVEIFDGSRNKGRGVGGRRFKTEGRVGKQDQERQEELRREEIVAG